MATSRPDGGPRVHPVCPLVTEGSLFAFIVPSPKRDDLLRDGRYALHSFPAEDNEDAFYATGRAELVTDDMNRTVAAAQFAQERQLSESPNVTDWMLFSLDVRTCLLTRTTRHGDPAPQHSVWRERDNEA